MEVDGFEDLVKKA
jgi:hypothetical protein